MRRILVTGSRDWDDERLVAQAVLEHTNPGDELIHGEAYGADRIAEEVAVFLGDLMVRPFPARHFDSPLERNKYMVSLKPDLCLAFATRWASGTGHCARNARQADIPVIDLGVSTDFRAKDM